MTEQTGRLIATGNVAEVFEWGCRVLKLYKSPAAKPVAFHEAAIHATVEALGLPVPAVWGTRKIGPRWGIVFDRVTDTSFAARIRAAPDRAEHYLEQMARLHIAVHRHTAVPLTNLKHRLADRIRSPDHLSVRQREALLIGLAGMPDGDRVCHGDFHPMNILGDAERPWVIDWPDACRGEPAADVCRSYLLLELHAAELATPYLRAYCRMTGLLQQDVLAWLPYLAAAKLAEGVPGEAGGLNDILRRCLVADQPPAS